MTAGQVLLAAVFGLLGGVVGAYAFGWLGVWLFDKFGPDR